MRFGFFFVDINDVIKEGDGECIWNLYKVVVFLFKCYGYIKYVYFILFFFIKISVILLLVRVESFIVNRFCNVYGKLGKIIFMDLFLEFKNRFVRVCIDFLGLNFSEDFV